MPENNDGFSLPELPLVLILIVVLEVRTGEQGRGGLLDEIRDGDSVGAELDVEEFEVDVRDREVQGLQQGGCEFLFHGRHLLFESGFNL